MDFVEGRMIDWREYCHLLKICFPDFDRLDRVAEFGCRPYGFTPIAYKDGGRIISTAASLTMPFRRGTERIYFGALAAIATHPEYTKRGLARSLIEKLLERQRDQNILLFTGLPEMYGRFGFRAVQFNYFGIKNRSDGMGPANQSVRQFEQSRDRDQVISLHEQMAASSEVYLPVRDSEAWDYILRVTLSLRDAYVITEGDTAIGYFTARRLDGKCIITELFSSRDIDAAMASAINHLGQPCVIAENLANRLSASIFNLSPAADPFEQVMILERTPAPQFYIPWLDHF